MIRIKQINEEWLKANTKTKLAVSGTTSTIYICEDGHLYKRFLDPISSIDRDRWLQHFEKISFMADLEGQTFIRPREICLEDETITGYTMPYLHAPLLCEMKDISLQDLIDADDTVRKDMKEISRFYEISDLNMKSIAFDKKIGFQIFDFDGYYPKTDSNLVAYNQKAFYLCLLESLLFRANIPGQKNLLALSKIFNIVMSSLQDKESLVTLKECIGMIEQYLGPVQTKQDILRKASQRMI